MAEINEPLYMQIYRYLLNEINSGKYTDGKRLPTEKDLDEMFQVSRITSKKALEMLVKENIITRIPGKGTFVNDSSKDEAVVPNKSIHNEKNALIGVVLPDFSESYGIDLLAGIEKQCSLSHCFCTIKRSYGNQESEEKAIDDLVDLGVDGLIIMPIHGEYYNTKILRLILDDFPLVVIDRELKGIPSNFVGTDNIGATKKGIDYLFDLGHRNIGFFSPPLINTSTLENRMKGVMKGYTDKNIPMDKGLWYTEVTCTLPGKTNEKNVREDIQKIKTHILEHPQITAAFAAEYNIALVIGEAVKELGKKVPEDFSILCFDSPGNFLQHHEYTYLQQNQFEIGSKAVKILKKIFDDETMENNIRILLDAALIIGSSTAKVN